MKPYQTDKTIFEKFQEATRAYRAREIGDEEYLTARRAWMEELRKFDVSRGEAPPESSEE